MSDDFDILPRTIQQQIDSVFDKFVNPEISPQHPPRKRRKLDIPLAEAGGFLTESDSERGSPSSTTDAPDDYHDSLSFHLIPSALQLLGLPPDDDEVLQVFRNAAEGWSSGDIQDASLNGETGLVSRRDWRAVCAVLLADKSEETLDDEAAGGFIVEKSNGPDNFDNEMEADDISGSEEEDIYREPSLSEQDEDDSDEYQEGPSETKGKGKAANHKGKGVSSHSSSGVATSRQKQSALETFALFFPASTPLSEIELMKKRINYKDISQIAELLKEKIKADEVFILLFPSHSRLMYLLQRSMR